MSRNVKDVQNVQNVQMFASVDHSFSFLPLNILVMSETSSNEIGTSPVFCTKLYSVSVTKSDRI
jgi:hypothetical protein